MLDWNVANCIPGVPLLAHRKTSCKKIIQIAVLTSEAIRKRQIIP